MVGTKVTKIGGSLFVRIPAEEAQRLGLQHGSEVDVKVQPLGRTLADALKFRGKHRGRLPRLDKREFWGD